MIKRKVYQAKKTGLVSITIPGKMMKRWIAARPEIVLLKQYAGQTIDFLTLYEEHSVDRPYIKKNYKEVLRMMFEMGLISAVNPKTNKPPRKGSFSDEMRITFGGAV